jgi:hypothetical protein
MRGITYISTMTRHSNKLRLVFSDYVINCTNQITENNWCFIDMQNLYKGIQEKGWKVDWGLFRQYLKKNFNITKAVVFMGYIKRNIGLYSCLNKAGFEIEFRRVNNLTDGKIDGGNCDADLASYVMDHKNEYGKAIIIADDGDYCKMIESLIRQNKLESIISSHSLKNTSYLIKRIALNFIVSIESLRPFIEFKPKES